MKVQHFRNLLTTQANANGTQMVKDMKRPVFVGLRVIFGAVISVLDPYIRFEINRNNVDDDECFKS
jgi:hypothetical protein